MFYLNHQGLYDVLAIVDVCPTPFSVVAKKEVGNVPFLKQVFTCMKAYIMDREDIRQSMQVILDVTKEVKAGRNYLIFAEEPEARMEIIHWNLKAAVSKLQQSQMPDRAGCID